MISQEKYFKNMILTQNIYKKQKLKVVSILLLSIFLMSSMKTNFGTIEDNNAFKDDNSGITLPNNHSGETNAVEDQDTEQQTGNPLNTGSSHPQPNSNPQTLNPNQPVSDTNNQASNTQGSLSWLDYARMSQNKISALNGTLRVHAQVNGVSLANAYVEVSNTSGSIVTTGSTDVNGNFTSIIAEGTYTVTVNQTTNYSVQFSVLANSIRTVIATFGYLDIYTQDAALLPVSASIELRNATNGNLVAAGLQTGSNGILNITVATGTYNIFANANYGKTINGIIVTEVGRANADFTFGDITGKFGGLKVTSTGFMGMPLTTSVNLKFYATGANIETRTTSTSDGSYTWTGLAPDVYTVTFTESSTSIIFPNVQINENIQTNLSAQFGHILIYQDNTSNTFVELFHQGASSRFTYGWISSTTKLIRFIVAPGNYSVHYSGQIYNVFVNAGGKYLVNSQINSKPAKTSPTSTAIIATPARINANESTNISVRITDVNDDYDTIIFSYTPNVGSLGPQTLWFSKEDEYSSQITYTAPSTLQTMYIDINVSDGKTGYFTFRLYVSNQQGTINVNSTELAGIGLSGTFIELYRVSSGVRYSYNWANLNGWVNFTNVFEDEYYLKAYENNIQQSLVFQLVGNQIMFYNFKWAVLRINSTGLNQDLIDTSVTIYNQTVGINTNSAQTTSLSGDGTRTWYLAQGTYYAKASERNSIFKYNLNLVAEQLTTYEFKFSVMAVYYLDDNGNTASKFVQVYNGTNVGGARITYDWTSSITGFVVFILAPNQNYTVKVDHNATFTYYYENISILANQGVYVGQFLNHAPSITSVTASPATISAGQTTTLTVIATDPDVLDILTYVYVPSLGTITGSGNIVNYTAPLVAGFNYVNVSVIDSNGAFDNQTKAISSRTVNFVIHVRDSLNAPLTGKFVELYDWTTGVRNSYAWTDVSGNVTFNSKLENFYYLKAQSHNSITLSGKAYPADTPTYYITFTFGLLYVNSKKAFNALETTSISVLNNATGGTESSASTSTTGEGYYRFELRPDVYDLRATEQNTLRMEDIVVSATGRVNITFNWAVLNVTSLSYYGMPQNSFIEVYNVTTNVRVAYSWGDLYLGNAQFIVAPASDYQIRVYQDNTFQQNVSVIPNQQVDIVAQFGVIRVTRLDSSNNPQQSQYFTLYDQASGTSIKSTYTNANGQIFFVVIPGTYQVNSSNLGISYSNVVVNPLQRTDVGDTYNVNPIILLVTASPSRIGSNSSTVIRIEVRDDNYDYSTMNASFVLSTGSLGPLSRGWVQMNRYFFDITYFSPLTLELYQINITITDGSGGSADYMLIVSNRQGTLNAHSLSNLFQGVDTYILVTDQSTGATFSQYTGTDGLSTFVLYDGYYSVKASERNSQTQTVWVLGGTVVNVTFYWGDLVVYSTGAGGVPLSGTFIEIYEMSDTSTRIAYDWTNAQGFAKFTLRPGLYRVALRETTDIIFDNIEIVAGETLNLGSDVPKVTKPDDLLFFSGTTGNTISWTLTDAEPAYYNVTLDGTILIPATTWVNGTVVTVNLDFLSPGKYFLIINVNDTKGFVQSDLVVITVSVLNNTAPIFVTTPADTTYEALSTGNSLSWTVNDLENNADTYIFKRDGVVLSTGLWSPNVSLIFSIDGLEMGTYTFTLTVNDTNNAIITDTVSVSVVNTVPVITSPSDITFEAGTTGNTLSWTATDFQPNRYNIYKNNVVIKQGTWTSGNPITVTLDELLPGTYTIKIEAFDLLNAKVSDTVTVTVTEPASPIPQHTASLTSPADLTFNTTDTGQLISWKATYTYASGVAWKFYVDGVETQTGGLLNETYYFFDISALNLGPGLHTLRFEIIIEDFNAEQFTYSDTAIANVILQEILTAGTNDLSLEGESNATIQIDVDSSVKVVVVTSAEPTTNESSDALVTLEQDEGYSQTSYFVDITIEDNSVLNGVWINVSYASWDLVAMGIDEATLKIYFFNENTNRWEPAGTTGVDISRKIIYAYVTHLTAFAAVAIVPTPETSVIFSSSTAGSTTPPPSSTIQSGGAPGFEWLAILSLVAIPILRKKKLV